MRCKTCHYSLENLAGPPHRCPECGNEFDPLDPATFEQISGRTLLRMRHLVVLMAAVFVARFLASAVLSPPIRMPLDLVEASWFAVIFGPIVVLLYLVVLTILDALQPTD